jgi:Flp pilus assembly protein TadD
MNRLHKNSNSPAQNRVFANRHKIRKLGMRNSFLMVAVSTSALLAGCANRTDQAFKDVAPAAVATSGAPNAVAPLTQLSREALSRGDAAAAIPLAQRALESAPDNAEALLALAQAFLMSGAPVEAEQTFRDVLEKDATSTVGNTGLGLSLLSQHRLDEAQDALRLAAAQKPAPATLSNIAFALALAGAPAEAVKLLEPVALSAGSTPQLRQNLAFALVMSDNRARAFEVAGYDLDGVAAARQVATWSDIARKPFESRLTEMAGLTVVARPLVALAIATPVTVTPVQAQPVAFEAVHTSMRDVEKPVAEVAPVAPVPVVVVQKPATPVPGVTVATEAVPVKALAVKARPVVLRPKAVETPVVAASVSLPSLAKVQTTVRSVAKVQANVSKLVGWVVQVGAVTLKTDQSKGIAQNFQALLGKKAAPRVVVIDTPAGKLHRIVLGQATSKSVAFKTCASLKAKGRACFARDVSTLGVQGSVALAPDKAVVKPVTMKAVQIKAVQIKAVQIKAVPVKQAPVVPLPVKTTPVAKPVPKSVKI